MPMRWSLTGLFSITYKIIWDYRLSQITAQHAEIQAIKLHPVPRLSIKKEDPAGLLFL
jgi:hypothetical protein